MIQTTFTDIQRFQNALNKLQKHLDLLGHAKAKREIIRQSRFYFILGREQKEHDLRRANLVVLRIENRIGILAKELKFRQ